jgi:peptidyl-prolyl cis-trans isomerase D
MITSFRSILKSKIGAALALLLLVLIALAFAGGDIANIAGGGTVADEDTVAVVGDEPIGQEALVSAANNALEQARSNDPSVTMQQLLQQGMLPALLGQIVDRTATATYAREQGIVAGDRLVDSEITQLPVFQGLDGKFDPNLFQQALQQRGLSEALVRQDLAQGLLARQVALPAGMGVRLPAKMARRYAMLLGERRTGSVAVLPSALFAPEEKPTDQQLQAFYKANTRDFIRPERRTIRYATFDESVLKSVPPVKEEQVRARYDATRSNYAAQNLRKVTQLVLPTEAAAKAVAAEVARGTSLQDAARQKGLAVDSQEFLTREELASRYSPALANLAFSSQPGEIAGPVKGPVGWNLVRVDEVKQTPQRTLADVRGDIVPALEEEARRKAFASLTAQVEDKIAGGSSLADIARDIGVELKQAGPVVSSGAFYARPGAVEEAVQPIVKLAFKAEAGEPQITALQPGQVFAIYDVEGVQPSAPAPFAEIKDDIRLAWTLDKGSVAAKEAALKVRKAVAGGQSLAEALSAFGKRLPPIEKVGMTRQDITAARQQGRLVPPPVSLMFTMAKGTVKVQAAEQERGWFVVSLDGIEPASVEAGSGLVAGARGELGRSSGEEITAALTTAFKRQVGVRTNAEAVAAARQRLGGSGTSDDS